MFEVKSQSIRVKEQTATKWLGVVNREKLSIKNMLLMFNYAKGVEPEVEIRMYSRATLGDFRIPLQLEPVALPSADPDHYVLKIMPLKVKEDQTGRVFFQVSDRESYFEVEVHYAAGATGTLKIEYGDA